MNVEIVEFPEMLVAAVEHLGSPDGEHESVARLVRWRIRHWAMPATHKTFGVHYNDPFVVPPEQYRVDFCVAYSQPVAPNEEGVVAKLIPRLRCAKARHHGSRAFNLAADFLGKVWLPHSGEAIGNFPIFFHYINVGPSVQVSEMLTDVYLPLRTPACTIPT
jgi:AraC family transcriptional regulator